MKIELFNGLHWTHPLVLHVPGYSKLDSNDNFFSICWCLNCNREQQQILRLAISESQNNNWINAMDRYNGTCIYLCVILFTVNLLEYLQVQYCLTLPGQGNTTDDLARSICTCSIYI